jgi:Kef-type K+ transport system membrane component KefB
MVAATSSTVAAVVFGEAFHEVAVLVIAAAVLGALAVRLRQPLVVAFIAAGVLAGPSLLDVVSAEAEIHLLAELGIALVLFVVGLKLDVRIVRDTGRVAVVTGGMQIALTAGIGFGLALLLGLDATTAAYVAMALAFSSTIIVVKLLSDRREIDELHGRIAIGILIVQDLVVIGAIIALTAIGADTGASPAERAGLVVLKGVALVGGVVLAMRWALTPILHRLAHTPELLVLGAIAWGGSCRCATSCCSSSSSTWAPRLMSGVSAISSSWRSSCRRSCSSASRFSWWLPRVASATRAGSDSSPASRSARSASSR